jgi:cholesterol 7-dehydrogenase
MHLNFFLKKYFLVKNLAKVKKWPSKELNGFIYVWYHVENEAPWELPDFGIDQLHFQSSVESIVHTHIQDLMENIIDKSTLKSCICKLEMTVFSNFSSFRSRSWTLSFCWR